MRCALALLPFAELVQTAVVWLLGRVHHVHNLSVDIVPLRSAADGNTGVPVKGTAPPCFHFCWRHGQTDARQLSHPSSSCSRFSLCCRLFMSSKTRARLASSADFSAIACLSLSSCTQFSHPPEEEKEGEEEARRRVLRVTAVNLQR